MNETLLLTAMKLIEERGWSDLSMADVAAVADVPLDQVYQVFPTKNDIINAIAQFLDKETLKNIEQFSDSDTYRDRLFSVLMTRFDVAAKHKPVIACLWNEAKHNPLMILQAVPQGTTSMTWMLDAAHIDVSGATGAIKAQLFGVFYLAIVNAWLNDESHDSSETMAFIDRGLEKLELIPGFY